jgi:3-(3-hydroxy-phenyl)propionate hydroxylase
MPPVGRALPQPDVLGGDRRRIPLDDVLGPGFALLAVDPPADDPFVALRHPLWNRIGARRVAVVLGDRAPGRDSRRVADLDGQLGSFLGTSGRFVVVRPDRFVAATFAAAEEGRVAARLAELLGDPAAPPGACE